MKKFIQIFVCCIFAVAAISCVQKPGSEPDAPNQGGTTQSGGNNNGGSTGGTNNGGTTNDKPEEPLAYYLCGNFDDTDYAYGKDASKLGNYKFVNNKVAVTFTGSSNYVCVKDNRGNYYMFDEYTTSASGILKNYKSNMYKGEKMLVESGEYVFTLTDNGDDTFILSYSTTSSGGSSGVAYIRFYIESNSDDVVGLGVENDNESLVASLTFSYNQYSSYFTIPAGRYSILASVKEGNDYPWYYFYDPKTGTGRWAEYLQDGKYYELVYTAGDIVFSESK